MQFFAVNHDCVSCGQRAFTLKQKFWATSTYPVVCSHCGGASAVPASSSGFFTWFLLFALILVSVVLLEKGHGIWIFPAALLCALVYGWSWHRAKMWPVPKSYSQAKKQAGWGLAVFYLFLKLFQ